MYSHCCLCILNVSLCILIVVYVFSLLSMYSYCCLCILIVVYVFLSLVYVFSSLSMYSYCYSMYSYRCLRVVYVFLDAATLTEVFPCFFLSCKANVRVNLAKTGHGPHSPKLLCCSKYCMFCVVLFIVCV